MVGDEGGHAARGSGDGLNAKDNVGWVGALTAGEVGEVAAAS
jgi:hypothetical protein